MRKLVLQTLTAGSLLATFLLTSASAFGRAGWGYAGALLLVLGTALGARAQSLDVAGGSLSPAATTVTAGRNSGTLSLQGVSGTVLMYQADTGVGFEYAGGPGRTYTFRDLRTTTRFRAVVQTAIDAVVTSSVAVVTVVEAVVEAPVAVVDSATERVNQLAIEKRRAGYAPAVSLKFSPLATQDPITSALLLGVEYRPSARYGVEGSYGQQFTGLRITTLGLLYGRYDFAYRKLKLEVRRYLVPRLKHKNQETYLGVQVFYTPQRYTRYADNYFHDLEYYTYDRNFVTKDVFGLGMKAGSVWHLGERWQIEAGLGLGGRYVTTQYDLLNERRVVNFLTKKQEPLNQIEEPGSKGSIDVELVFKVGYVFPFHRD
ncbi:hypothetical protein GCM10022409_18690 [Hymenobacter glaciei]|uniref:Outer membrane protein beta-barrel domain-containing protein n=1 Tax=Hymenobacter glaciei TaxID=877209 RepID=A0ABP7U1Q4_9BACT